MFNAKQRASLAQFCYDSCKGALLAPLAQSWLTGLKPQHFFLYGIVVLVFLLIALDLERGGS